MKKLFKKTNIRPVFIIAIVVLIFGGLGIFYVLSNSEINEPSVDFGYLLDEGEELAIEAINPEPIDDVEIYAYDFKLSTGQPKGTIEISIPYDDRGLKEDEEIFSVCGKYLNEETGEWEDTFYTVDSKTNTVRIVTDHLSTYAVFKITNPSKRSAYIGEVNVYAVYMSKDKATKLLETYAKQGATWKEDVASATLDALGSTPMFVATSIPTLLTLGGAYDELISSPLSNSITALGISTACAQFAFDAYNNGLSSKETAMSAMKSTLNAAINYATPSIQLAYVGVGMIDLALTDVSTFAISNKYRSTKNMYDAYYKRSAINRKIKDWTKIFETIYKENKNEPQKVLDLITKEIDRYVQEYWEVAGADWESWIDSYDRNGSLAKYPWPSEKDRNNISSIFKSELYGYLSSAFRVMSRNIYLDSLNERQKDYQKIADYYNRQFSIVIREDIKSGKSSTWAGYYAKLAPLSSEANSSSWTGKLNESGGGRITFTLLAHQTAGFPMKLELYKTAKDVKSGKKALTVTLNPFSESEQTVTLQPRKINEEIEDSDNIPSETDKPDDKPPVSTTPVQEDNPWYEATIKATDNSKSFAGWSAVLQYPDNSSPDLKNMYKDFSSKGECIIYFQKSDYDGLESPSQIWLYKNKADLLAKAKPNQIARFSLTSASYSGELHGEPFYKMIVKAKPLEDKLDILESITGKYSSYMIYSEYIEEYEFYGSIQEMKKIENFQPWEKPSANVTLHYNGPSLTYTNAADPYQTEVVLDKTSDTRYEKTIVKESSIINYYIEISSIGERAKITITSERPSPVRKIKQEYILNKINN
ncbi:MAG: hypothetical protein PHS98_03360 [Bacilli bacterium]|nr:hypothetical protein [Bacilli bacterium]